MGRVRSDHRSVYFAFWFLALAGLLVGCQSRPAPARGTGTLPPPRLIVAILVDGLGQNQLIKCRDQFGPGGFRRLLEEGAWYEDARYGHSTTITAVGHGTWLTGAYPYRHGMISNDWYDRKTKKTIYCTEDPSCRYLGEPTKEHQGTSPKKLQVTTVGDELRAATSMKSRVFAASLKDRGAILPAGRLGTAYFYSPETGRFITSDFYMEEFPQWWSDFHRPQPQDRWFGTEWKPVLPDEAYQDDFDEQPLIPNYKGLGKKFPHRVDGGPIKVEDKETKKTTETPPRIGPAYYAAIEGTPFGHEYLAEFAKTLVEKEGLGNNPDGATDLLAISFSSHDFINHTFGPESMESHDDLLRLDRTLADFFRFLDARVGLSSTLVVLTADHGFSPSPEYLKEVLKFDSSRLSARVMLKKLNDHLGEKFGLGAYAVSWKFPTIWLDYDLIDSRRLGRSEVEEAAARFLSAQAGVQSVFTRTQLSRGELPRTRLGTLVSRAWHPELSGDLLVLPKDGWIFSELTPVASHGTPWTYDTRVPLMFLGPSWVRAGRYLEKAEPTDIAPTLSAVLWVPPPSGSEGRALYEILK